jgi:hypothetical protein
MGQNVRINAKKKSIGMVLSALFACLIKFGTVAVKEINVWINVNPGNIWMLILIVWLVFLISIGQGIVAFVKNIRDGMVRVVEIFATHKII